MRGDATGAGPDIRAERRRIARGQHHQSRIVYPAVGIFEPMGELRTQRLACRIVAQVQSSCRRQDLPSAQMVVQKEPGADHPSWPQPGMVRQHEPQRPYDMRRGAPQHLALGERFAYQAEGVMLQIAQPAMDQLR